MALGSLCKWLIQVNEQKFLSLTACHSLHPSCRLQQQHLLLIAWEHPLTSQRLFKRRGKSPSAGWQDPLLGGLLIHWA